MPYPKEFQYTKEHEWAKREDGKVRMGITEYAQGELGDVVYVELPKVGRQVKQNESIVTIESVKSVSDVYAPISGKVIEVNQELEDKPELINQSAHDKGWICVIELSDPNELKGLMDVAAYQKHIGNLSHE
jgi:glycine cleavage system H protein